jgi:hypothetical protein
MALCREPGCGIGGGAMAPPPHAFQCCYPRITLTV